VKNKKALILIGLIIGFLSTISAQSYLLRYKWQEGDVYHYKLTVKSPQFGSQEFFYDQIVEKIYTPGEASFTFKTPLGTFKAKSTDIHPSDGAAIVRIVYTKGTDSGKEIPTKELLKNLLLYIKPNGETYVIQRKQVSGSWVFELTNVTNPEEKDEMRKFFKSPTSVEYSISDNTVLTEYDPDGIFHPVYLPDHPVTLGEKWNFSMAGVKADFSFDKMATIDAYNCALLNANGEFSDKEMMKGMPGMPEGMETPELGEMMPEFKEKATFYFEPDKGMLVRVIDRTEIKGPLNAEFDSRLDLVSAELKSGQKISIKAEALPEVKSEEKPVTAAGATEVKLETKEAKVEAPEEMKEETDTYLLTRKKSENGETVLKILEPEGAMVTIKSEKSQMPIHEAEIPTMKKGLPEGFYKIEVTGKTGKWEKKIEIKKGMEHLLYVKLLTPEAKEEIKKAMGESSFQELLKSIENESFENTRTEILEDAAGRNYFTCQQLIDILKLFTFENNKIQACKIVYPKLVDQENFHMVYPSFTFSASKTEIKEWIKKYESGETEEKGDE